MDDAMDANPELPKIDVDPNEVSIESDQPTITEVVEEASDSERTDTAAARYEDAMEFFLADENDLKKNPLRDDAVVWRYDTEAEEDRPLVVIPIRNLEDREIKSLRQQSKEKGAGGIRTDETDEQRFFTLVCAEAAVFSPDQEAKIRSRFRSIEHMLMTTLLSGERIALGQHILGFSGFGAMVQSRAKTEVDAAKN